MSKTYTKEEVIELLTELTKFHVETTFGAKSQFEFQRELEYSPRVINPSSMYKTIYGQVMSILEATVDSSKLDASKTLARQLLLSTQMEFHDKMHNNFKDAILGNMEHLNWHPYTLINRKLNK